MREIKCPSGSLLKVSPASFADSKELYQAILVELKHVNVADDKDGETDILKLCKDVFCMGFASPVIESALWKCFPKCIYNSGGADTKIDKNTFEPEKAREDYGFVCMEVIKENVSPFLKNLSAQFGAIMDLVGSNH